VEKGKLQDRYVLSKSSGQRLFLPTDIIRDYYGEEVAIYFEWMNFFLRWIAVPGGLAIIIRTCNTLFFEDVSKSPLNAVFSIGMGFWATLFIVNWRRHQRSLKVLWENVEDDAHELEEIRHQFKGEPRVNPINEQVEPYFPDSARYLAYL